MIVQNNTLKGKISIYTIICHTNYFIDLYTFFMELCLLDISKVVCEVSAWAWRSLQSLHSIPQYSCMLNTFA